MIYLAAFSLAVAVGLTVYLVGQLIPARPRVVRERLAEVEALGFDAMGASARRDRTARRERVVQILEEMGTRLQGSRDMTSHRLFLAQAGYRGMAALPVYWGLRLAMPILFGVGTLMLAPALTTSAAMVLFAAAYFSLLGYIAPTFVVRSKKNARQKDIQKTLPDALDLLVVCVEAGLGLNQALLRVAQEIGNISQLTASELALVNAEIRAGVPREEALRNLADRTGVDDVRSLVTVLIQTDRFGTSVARALRVHSETMRTKRRQRAEEAAAKTTIKLVFPLAFCIFPSMFVVVLGPALIRIAQEFSTLGG